ncbi:hypothetical protein [Parasphingorhabdus sp.]|uniref:hypothetical protein n=1 Tax=Parasphingorhabdus sp. TaxID=2709688 RepID=UPI0032664D51
MSRSLVLLLLILCPGIGHAQNPEPDERTLQLLANARKLVAVDADGCLINSNPDEIIVCAGFDPNRAHRLPFPELAVDPTLRVSDPLPKGNAQIVQQTRCYVTYSERNCFKGLPLVSISFGGAGGGVDRSEGNLWSTIQPQSPDEDYIKRALTKPLDQTP